MTGRWTTKQGAVVPMGLALLALAVLAACAGGPAATPAGSEPTPGSQGPVAENPSPAPTATEEAAETPAAEGPATEDPMQSDWGEDAGGEDERIWQVDERGRRYYIERVERYQGAYEWIDENRVRYLGVTLHLVDYDEEYFYIRAYETPESRTRPLTPPQPSPEELEAVEATYRADLPSVDRLRFSPFDRGLPGSGQWRNGFDVVDMNRDGHLDVVHGPPRKGNGLPVVFLGDGAGSWRRWPMRFPARYDYGDVAAADFNGDGHLDLALGIHLRGLKVLVGDGRGTFTEWSEGIDYEVPGEGGDPEVFSSRTVEVVDWDGDGRTDLLALGEGPRLSGQARKGMGPLAFVAHGPAIFLNQGDGTWTKLDKGIAMEQIFGDGLAVGDFDGDDRVDFATASNRMGRRDLVNLGEGARDWQATLIPELRPNAYVRDVSAADFDGDGVDDLAVAYLAYEAQSWRNGIDLFYSRPPGEWERRTLFARPGQTAIYALDSGDLDGDGTRDLVALDGDGEVLVFLGDGERFFAREESFELDQPVGRCRGYAVRLVDLDEDGRDEVVATFADEANPLFDPTRCPRGGGIAAWEVAEVAPAP